MRRIASLLPLLQFLFAPATSTAQRADLILTNGKVFTADPARPRAEAVAIRGNRILAVGTNRDIERLASATTRRIDLAGRTVVPGFNDAHDHAGWDAPIGKRFAYAEMRPAGLSRAAVLDSLTRLIRSATPNQWITGLIGTVVLSDSGMRSTLDSIAPNNPVALQAWWGHGLVVNRRALEESGLSDSVADPLGGWYVRRAGTNTILALHENAQAPVWFALNRSEPTSLIKGMRAYAQVQLRHGITSVQYMGTGFTGAFASQILRRAHLPQRIRIVGWPQSTAIQRQLSDWDTDDAHPTSLTTISGIKYMFDGTPLEGGSLNKVPHTTGEDRYGRLDYPRDSMRQILQEALNSKRQLMMHITGDSTLAVVLSLMKQLAPADRWRSKRVRIEHNSTPNITASELRDVRALGLLVMHTPKYNQSSAVRSYLDAGITVGISPDGTTNPFFDIMVVTTQQTNPRENLSREQAVIAYTRTNAYAEFAEQDKGTLAKGMVADLAVLSQDIFSVAAAQLPSTVSELTVVDGKVVYERRRGVSRRR
jgi:predicted amidohydrolase YtcJ